MQGLYFDKTLSGDQPSRFGAQLRRFEAFLCLCQQGIKQ